MVHNLFNQDSTVEHLNGFWWSWAFFLVIINNVLLIYIIHIYTSLFIYVSISLRLDA